MDYTEPEKRTGSDSRRSGIDRREKTVSAQSGSEIERRAVIGDRRLGFGRRRTDLIPLNLLEQLR